MTIQRKIMKKILSILVLSFIAAACNKWGSGSPAQQDAVASVDVSLAVETTAAPPHEPTATAVTDVATVPSKQKPCEDGDVGGQDVDLGGVCNLCQDTTVTEDDAQDAASGSGVSDGASGSGATSTSD
jgi:hypothetical protein